MFYDGKYRHTYLLALKKWLNKRDEKDVSTGTVVVLAKLVLNNNIFNFYEKTLKQKKGKAMETQFSSLYNILFMALLEERIS